MASDFKTIFTSVGATDLQLSPTEWTVVSLQLETAGPVIVGTKAELAPISAGKGIYLSTSPRYFLLGPSERLYTLAGSLNRVSMSTHTLPSFVQVIMKLDEVVTRLVKAFPFTKR